MVRAWLFVALASVAAPASADWRTESEAVRAAAKEPVIASALAAMDALDTAILARDIDACVAALAPDLVVNDPGNTAHPSAVTAQTFRAGLIDYSSYVRTLDLVALRPSGEVVAMGWETVVPRGKARGVGKTMRRRFTDVWRKDDGVWKLALRQATIVEVK